jgi:hypothetical protein
MTDETQHKVSEDNPRRLQKIVIGLAVIYVMTFLSGFLQDTQFNFINYIFFSLLFIGGIVLIRVTLKSEATEMTKGILFLTGISTTLLFIFYIGYELLRLKGYEDFVGSIEALLYLTTLFFWILVIISLVLIRRIGGRNSSQS